MGLLRGGRKILKGRTSFRWVFMQNISVRVVLNWRRIEKELDGRATETKMKLAPSALFTDVNNYLLAQLSQKSGRCNTKRNGRPFIVISF